MTLAQLEALWWATQLGSFSHAAVKLCITQAALSKRIADLESELGVVLFDRSRHRPKPSAHALRLLDSVRRMLDAKQDIFRAVRAEGDLQGNCAFGTTELAALTWLPHLVSSLRQRHPKLVLQPFIALAGNLQRRLRQGEIDMAVMPFPVSDPRLESQWLARVEFAWMASPNHIRPGTLLTAAGLATHQVLTQSSGSGLTLVFDDWAAKRGISITPVFSSNSLVVTAALTSIGLGISVLPVGYFRPLVESGSLCRLNSVPELPSLDYYMVWRANETSTLLDTLKEATIDVCDFDSRFFTDRAL